jgi:hypothetical protein
MTWLRLVRSELRKLTTTRMPWAFVAVLAVLAATTALAVVMGTDMDGSKAFISTAADQQSLFAFGWNALVVAALFGAIATSREYGHLTVVPTFLVAPRRRRTMLAQYAALLLAGAALGLVGEGLTLVGGAIALPLTDYGFLVPAGTVARLVATTAVAGSIGAVIGGGVGALVRNTGGAVASTVVVLLIAPPLVVQLASASAQWIPDTLVPVLSGLGSGPSLPAALAALAAWALVPALAGIVAVQRRDIV